MLLVVTGQDNGTKMYCMTLTIIKLVKNCNNEKCKSISAQRWCDEMPQFSLFLPPPQRVESLITTKQQFYSVQQSNVVDIRSHLIGLLADWLHQGHQQKPLFTQVVTLQTLIRRQSEPPTLSMAVKQYSSEPEPACFSGKQKRKRKRGEWIGARVVSPAQVKRTSSDQSVADGSLNGCHCSPVQWSLCTVWTLRNQVAYKQSLFVGVGW